MEMIENPIRKFIRCGMSVGKHFRVSLEAFEASHIQWPQALADWMREAIVDGFWRGAFRGQVPR